MPNSNEITPKSCNINFAKLLNSIYKSKDCLGAWQTAHQHIVTAMAHFSPSQDLMGCYPPCNCHLTIHCSSQNRLLIVWNRNDRNTPHIAWDFLTFPDIGLLAVPFPRCPHDPEPITPSPPDPPGLVFRTGVLVVISKQGYLTVLGDRWTSRQVGP